MFSKPKAPTQEELEAAAARRRNKQTVKQLELRRASEAQRFNRRSQVQLAKTQSALPPLIVGGT